MTLDSQGKFEEPDKLLKRALKIYEKHDDDYPNYAAVLSCRARMVWSQVLLFPFRRRFCVHARMCAVWGQGCILARLSNLTTVTGNADASMVLYLALTVKSCVGSHSDT